MPEQKELRFFEIDVLYTQGQQAYEQYFKDAPLTAKQVGEASPPYFHEGITRSVSNQYTFNVQDDCPTRIKQMMPQVKIILTLRSPATRLFSQYIKNLRQGKEEYYTLEEAIEAERKGDRSPTTHDTSWLYKNTYSIHLQKWFSLFPRENILVLIFEKWKDNPINALNRVAEFLQIDPFENLVSNMPDARERNINREPRLVWLHKWSMKYLGNSIPGKIIYRLNQKKSVTKLTQQQKQYLVNIFKTDMAKVEQMLGEDLTCWNQV